MSEVILPRILKSLAKLSNIFGLIKVDSNNLITPE